MLTIKRDKPAARVMTPEEQIENNYQYYLQQLKNMEPFTFRASNYIYNREDRGYYPFYEMEVYKQGKGTKPKGMSSDRYFQLVEQEKKYKELKILVAEYEVKVAQMRAAKPQPKTNEWDDLY